MNSSISVPLPRENYRFPLMVQLISLMSIQKGKVQNWTAVLCVLCMFFCWSAVEASLTPPCKGEAGKSNGSTGEASPIPPCKGGAGEAAWSAGEAFLIPPCEGGASTSAWGAGDASPISPLQRMGWCSAWGRQGGILHTPLQRRGWRSGLECRGGIPHPPLQRRGWHINLGRRGCIPHPPLQRRGWWSTRQTMWISFVGVFVRAATIPFWWGGRGWHWRLEQWSAWCGRQWTMMRQQWFYDYLVLVHIISRGRWIQTKVTLVITFPKE